MGWTPVLSKVGECPSGHMPGPQVFDSPDQRCVSGALSSVNIPHILCCEVLDLNSSNTVVFLRLMCFDVA